MTSNWADNKEEYLEALNMRGEIEFNYNNHHYHIESTNYQDDSFDIWKFTASGSNDGRIIAHCNNPQEVLSVKAFDGKTLEEIDNLMTDCYIL